jgi:hypothetical protein
MSPKLPSPRRSSPRYNVGHGQGIGVGGATHQSQTPQRPQPADSRQFWPTAAIQATSTFYPYPPQQQQHDEEEEEDQLLVAQSMPPKLPSPRRSSPHHNGGGHGYGQIWQGGGGRPRRGRGRSSILSPPPPPQNQCTSNYQQPYPVPTTPPPLRQTQQVCVKNAKKKTNKYVKKILKMTVLPKFITRLLCLHLSNILNQKY